MCPPAACFKEVSFGKTKLGKIGETISEKWLETAVFWQKRAFEAIFQNSELPLTPSFVGSNPATPAKNGRFLAILAKNRPFLAYDFCFLPNYFRALGRNWGVIGE